MLVDAVAGLQADIREPARTYFRFVEQHRGRAEAERALASIKQLATSDAWADVRLWPANGYRPVRRNK